MRLDKYLKISRIIKRRSVADEACSAGRVVVNGRPQKSAYQVKIGDIIEVRFGDKLFACRVLQLTSVVRKDDAAGMYELLDAGSGSDSPV